MRTLFALLMVVSSASCISPIHDNFGNVGQALDAVMIHHFSHHIPEKPFSIATSGLESPQTAIPQDHLDAVLERLCEAGKHFVPFAELRIPKHGEERDPKNPDAFRGIEVRDTGERVDVFSLNGIVYLDPQRIKVYWSMSSGVLSGGGGAYIVRRNATGFIIEDADEGMMF